MRARPVNADAPGPPAVAPRPTAVASCHAPGLDAGPRRRATRVPARISRRGVVAPGLLPHATTLTLKEEYGMKTFMGAWLVLALLLAVGGAWAAEIEGKIQSVDAADR